MIGLPKQGRKGVDDAHVLCVTVTSTWYLDTKVLLLRTPNSSDTFYTLRSHKNGVSWLHCSLAKAMNAIQSEPSPLDSGKLSFCSVVFALLSLDPDPPRVEGHLTNALVSVSLSP